jgi:hypothetical protein
MHPVAEDEDVTRAADSITRLLAEGFRPGDIVFFEKQGSRVVTLGHHFRYRWRCRDSIRRHAPQPSSQTAVGDTPRDVLCPTPLGEPPGTPQALTGASLLFGYMAAGAGQDGQGAEPAAGHKKILRTTPWPSVSPAAAAEKNDVRRVWPEFLLLLRSATTAGP